MKRLTSKWTSFALVLALVMSLVAPLTTYAASIQLTINNLYTIPTLYADGTTNSEPDDRTNSMFKDASVQRFTTTPIASLPVTINGIPDDKINDIYYEILNLNTGIPSVNTTNKAVKNPNNSNEIIFTNVVLTEGLNKIVIKYGDSSVVSSRAGWAYFTSVTNITDLEFNGAPFVDNEMFPKGPPYTSLSITGTANNATQIQAYVTGAVYSPTVMNRGVFTYITNTGRSADLNFAAGDNKIKFLAKNNSNSYSAERSFIYDNGRGFAFNALVGVSDAGTTTTPQKMVDVPTVTKETAATVKVQAELKVPLTSSGLLSYSYIEGSIASSGYKVRYDLGPDSITVNGTQSTTITPSSVLNSTYSVARKYNVYDFVFDLPINNGNKKQNVVFDFGTAAGVQDTTQYSFTYINPNTPYVEFVDQYISATDTVKLTEVGTSQINEFPTKLDVYTTHVANQIEVKVGGALYTKENSTGLYTVTAPAAGTYFTDKYGNPLVDSNGLALSKATINLQGITDGFTTLQITPIINSNLANPPAPSEYFPEGLKIFNLQISSTPYVILNDIYTGKVFSKPSQIMCPNSNVGGPCISGRLVNLPPSEYPNVKFYVNDAAIPLKATGAAGDEIDITTGTFKIDAADFAAQTPDPFAGDGKKTIRFSLFLNGKLVSESITNVFILSDNVPAVTSFNPIEPDPTLQQFKMVGTDAYVTRLSKIQLKGDVRNSTRTAGTPEYDISYTVPNTTNKPKLTAGQYKTPVKILDDPTVVGSNFTESFSTYDIDLSSQYGDYIFEVTATNSTGTIATKSIKITREPLPYFFTEPAIFSNVDGKDQANVNANFQTLTMVADKADSVVFGKDTAVKQTGPLGDTFTYEARDLKPGKNEIKFTVTRGTAKTSGSIILDYVNTPIEGAQYKSKLGSSIKVFNGDIELKFPKDTKLMRNDRSKPDQFLTDERTMLFGIADIDTGQVDKLKDTNNGQQYLSGVGVTPRFQQIGRFKAASKRYWIDAGTIADFTSTDPNYQAKLRDALQGSGITPLSPSAQPFFGRSFADLVVPNKTATLTLKFDPSIRDDAWKYVSVFQYNIFEGLTGGGETEQGWRNIGGVVDSKKNTITVDVDSFGYFQVMYMNNSFEDVTNHPWARNDLDTLYSKGLMFNKDPGGRFLPNDAITRGEFVTMLVDAFDIPLKNNDTFSRSGNNNGSYNGTFLDVIRGNNIQDSNGIYDYMHIEAAARAGIVRGTSQGLFLPNTVITRQDAAVMIARAADLKMGTDDKKSLAALQKLFTDANSIDIYARTAVEAVSKAGYIEGKDNVLLQGQKKTTQRFDPTDNLTRAESATIVIRILKSLKKIPK
ncbi:S-layer homology domain-containing protein [Paenibacillus cremeus]|uniref:S-layer homology domain-containing protein n=1 Tax=Paenibacillus cremeus TaxID=2163881 RepID=A0A559KB15_9BACL|nr:S-layer homology domain-containing protein [Paenibacillus cremeus]TVY09321.1 S-layer homology domain-containing protein [Paenibacillus cremeus]